ncbi:hypothetical protein [Aureliella helgolandensis]|uniref:Uncharacterized protein n=1 Tax=Aureliella helgolandensis TaxID=2527968 RepID=A0A518G4Q0_9BACT|nr:hypothetical protein [Aureliella helgolandensis]QDV23575.1 hypothetical protein Q31a_18770 [Aureliella helgolandensis]
MAKKAAPRKRKPAPPTHEEISHHEAIAQLQNLLRQMQQRSVAYYATPRRGITDAAKSNALPIDYEIPISGGKEVLQHLASGKLNVVSQPLLEWIVERLR